MRILAINDCSDSSAALVEDGRIIAAVEEERFTYRRHIDIFPFNAIEHVTGGDFSGIDRVVYTMEYNDFRVPRFDRYQVFPATMLRPPAAWLSAVDRLPQSLIKAAGNAAYWTQFNALINRRKLERRYMQKRMGLDFEIVRHHLAHASSAYRASGFGKANILVMDGSGEKYSTSLFVGDGEIEPVKDIAESNSMGILYTFISLVLGLGRFGQGKTMGLAPYGTPRPEYVKMVEVLHHDYNIRMDRVRELARHIRYGGEPTKEHQDIAASLQEALERVAIEMVDCLHETSGYKDLCLAGGVVLNCSMNGVLLRTPMVDRVFVQPAASDAGTTLGAAFQLCYEEGVQVETMITAALGPSYHDDAIARALADEGLAAEPVDDPASTAAVLIAEGKVIGWYQGRLEFGPRALGQRSILADPTDPDMHDRVNRIKNREMWRPLAPSVLIEHLPEYFESDHPSPFMILTCPVREEKQDEIPAVTHVDGSARLQTVDGRATPLYHKLISRFAKEGKPPVVLNTSFNSRGQPIVRTPYDAIRTFKRIGLDAMVIGGYLVTA